ncbi:beta-fructofuranosidase [Lactobacillus hamsteri DSM 5661 = JCM 6256]|uniref:Sucrose-6-phosphate hydrolase n=2 Tax=Lactobacillus hamsteri TaxID=96565 RepID=A0A0R1Y628_9LACO|nr:beta-fructofuranosidase [Lactobacillus hamsteri DSM 5661 = JCM 6256]
MVKHLADVPSNIVTNEIDLTNQSPYRQNYHVESESGSLGDPNGFSYFNHQYHLFYQWSPLAFSKNPHYTQHGWKHLVSKNLIDWQDLGAGIESDTVLDKHGTYSGSALPVDNRLFLMYTGNTWTNTESEDDWHRVPYQVGAMMDKDNKVKKWMTPLLKGPLKGYTGHFRDPKIFKKNGIYYAVLGIQRENLTGAALLIKSSDLHKWSIVGEIKADHNNFGYMWECPDYYEINNHGILEFCPQGLETSNNKYRNIYQNGYLIGNHLNLENGQFDCGEFHELDKGFDFYAMQTMRDSKGRRLLIAWMGLPETKYPTEKFHYTGCMIFPRELQVKDGVIIQKPVKEIKDLYQEQFLIEGKTNKESIKLEAGKSNSRDIQLELDCTQAYDTILDLFANEDNTDHLRLIFNHKKQEFIVNRGHCGLPISEAYGAERSCHLDLNKKIKVRILQDVSSAEIFLNDGKDVFSMRVFTDNKNNHIFITSHCGEASYKAKINQLRYRK